MKKALWAVQWLNTAHRSTALTVNSLGLAADSTLGTKDGGTTWEAAMLPIINHTLLTGQRLGIRSDDGAQAHTGHRTGLGWRQGSQKFEPLLLGCWPPQAGASVQGSTSSLSFFAELPSPVLTGHHTPGCAPAAVAHPGQAVALIRDHIALLTYF